MYLFKNFGHFLVTCSIYFFFQNIILELLCCQCAVSTTMRCTHDEHIHFLFAYAAILHSWGRKSWKAEKNKYCMCTATESKDYTKPSGEPFPVRSCSILDCSEVLRERKKAVQQKVTFFFLVLGSSSALVATPAFIWKTA